MALKTFPKGKFHVTVSLQLDNTTAVAYINNKLKEVNVPPTYDFGLRDVGLVSGKRHPRDIFSHPRKRQRLSGQGVQRVQGHERVEVGPNNYKAFSAELSDGSVCESSNQPTCRFIVSWKPNPGAIHTNAFTIYFTWAPLQDYAFPPSI